MPERSGERIDPHPPRRVRRPMLHQSWTTSTWIHWPYDPVAIEHVVPDGLELDTFGGRAWVGLVPFVIENQRLPGTPALPWLSRAHETHLRTYVTAPDGRSGAWFFYLENSLLPGVLAARTAFFLRYVWSAMSLRREGNVVEYWGKRRLPPGAEHGIRVELGEPYAEDELRDLDHFVTAQWILFLHYGRVQAAVPVEHPAWPMRRARLLHLEGNILESAGVPPPEEPPLVHFSSGVDARVGFPRLVSRGG